MSVEKIIRKGIVACRGKVRGKVLLEGNIKKIKSDGIIVCESLHKELLKYVKKIKGIVCEEGGILSHTAIVSRELKIPCVVGVSEITRIVKEGDEIEINGSKVIVYKCNKGVKET